MEVAEVWKTLSGWLAGPFFLRWSAGLGLGDDFGFVSCAYADFSEDDLGESHVCFSHAGAAFDEGGAACIELAYALGDEVDEHGWVCDDLGGLVDEIGFH
jgi:hypothetical protein